MVNNYEKFDTDVTPKFDSAMGFIILLDNLFRFASGYLISGSYNSYYRTLECIYIELKYHADKSKQDINKLNNYRDAASPDDIEQLKEYHMQLNDLANKCKLRMKDKDHLPGVMKQ